MATWNISISNCGDGRYELRLKIPGAPGGGHRSTRSLPPDFSDFVAPETCNKPNRKWRRDPASADKDNLLFCAGNLDTLKEIGERLYDSLSRFGPEGEVEDFTSTFLALRAKADLAEGLGLRIDLTDAPELSRVPWEALYLAKKDLFLGIDTRTNIVRHLESDSDADLPPPVEPPIRILVAVANLGSELEAEPEVANIERRLGCLPRDDRHYAIETLERATRAELRGRIGKWKPHIIHFIGHGGFDDEKGLIYLHSGKDSAARDAIDSATLRELVRNARPWLIVLNSCLSGAAAKADPFGGAAQNLIRANIPFVVAMQAPISDDAAVQFSQDFYAALASGQTVATAVSSGRSGIRTLEDESLQAELVTPVLYSTGKAERIEILERKGRDWKGLLGIFAGIAAIFGVPIGIMQIVSQRSPDTATSAPAASDELEHRSANAVADVGQEDGPAAAARAPGPMMPSYPPPSPAPAPPRPGDPDAENPAFAERGAWRIGRPSASTGRFSRPAQAGRELVMPRQRSEPREARPRPDLPGEAADALAGAFPAVLVPQANPRAVVQSRRNSSGASPSAAARAGQEARADELRRQARLQDMMGALIDRRWSETQRTGRDRRQVVDLHAAQVRADQSAATAAAIGGPAGPAVSTMPSTLGLPLAAEVALFEPGSLVPEQVAVARYAAVLAAPVDPAMAIELVGTAAPGEGTATGSEPGLARAELVAEALRGAGVENERIVVASAGARWVPAPYEPELLRAVEARLVLADAARIGFAPGSAQVGAGDGATLDRIAAFVRENPRYWLKLEGHAEPSEPVPLVLSRGRIDAVVEELLRRGVDERHVRMRLYGAAHPEAVGPTGAGADRRVQIVLIPPFGPDAPQPSAPPPDLPTPP